MAETSPMIDPKVLQVDMQQLISDNPSGLSPAEASARLARRETYAAYPVEYILQWSQSMLAKLADQGLVVLKGARYFPSPSILQDTPPKPEEYLPPEVTGRAERKQGS